MNATDFDLLIVGGGMAGASLACALHDVPLRVGVLEAVPLAADEQPSFDARAIALAEGSRRILAAMGVWEGIARRGATAIRHIHVSERGGFGVTRLAAADEGVDALGHVVESRVLGGALMEAVADLPHSRFISPARLIGLTVDAEAATVRVETEQGERDLTARLVVAADGGRSTVRQQIGARSWRLGYGQTAIIATVLGSRPHGGVAFERFTDSGPLALLPCNPAVDGAEAGWGDRRWSLVWTVRDSQVEEVMALDAPAFLARLQARFGGRAGRFEQLGGRHAYPLGLEYVRDHVRPRIVFIGNAAHTIHPVAGQGFNLGLRDVAALAEVLAGAVAAGRDPGGMEVLGGYAAWRRPDYLRVMGMTDSLARLFSNRLPLLRAARNLGLLGMDLLPGARHRLARQAMGLTGRLPRLARGLPLTGRDVR